MDIKAYKIQDKVTGLFSTGGMSPKWTKRGKTWSQLNHIKTHLKQFISDSSYMKEWINNIPESWQVVELSSSGIIQYDARPLYPIENIYKKQ